MRKLLFLLAITAGACMVGTNTLLWAGQLEVTAGVGVEGLKYEEHVPIDAVNAVAVNSVATVVNTVVNGSLEYDFANQFFVGAKGTMPVAKGNDSEAWSGLGVAFQNNNLEYGWSRADVYAGYSFGNKDAETTDYLDTFDPYIGIRGSWAAQKRSDFIVLGMPLIQPAVVEKINSYGTLLGFRMQRYFPDEKLTLGFNVEGVLPFNVEVTNTTVPDTKFDSNRGYTWKVGVYGEFKVTPRLFLGLDGYGGRMHWNGSQWQAFDGGGFVKWPENDTTYFGGNMSLKYKY